MGPLAWEAGLNSDKLFAGDPRVPSYATVHGAGLHNKPGPV